MRIVNTEDWPWERLAPYGAEITAAMKKLVDRFPKDVTVESLAQECLTGHKQLWLILDGDRFVSFAITELRSVDATGHRMVSITSFAGEEGESTVPLISEIEAWAKDRGAMEATIIGRMGWKRSVATQGYKIDAVLYRKPL